MERESLIVVGTGIRIVGQLTMEALAWIREADKVLYLVAEPVAERVIRRLGAGRAESLAPFYGEGKERGRTYAEIVERILLSVRSGGTTCAVFYGHPGVFVEPSHEAVRRARAEGFGARMLPGISAEDCLVADLGVDPGGGGCQSYEATDFLINGRRIDPSSHLILWQVGVLGHTAFRRLGYDPHHVPHLVERLSRDYPADHRVCVYEAALFPGRQPRTDWVPLRKLAALRLSPVSTLYLPPAARLRPDLALYRALGIPLKL